jgi:hypothetical protein
MIEWSCLYEHLGYPNTKDMLTDMYENKQMSTKAIGEKLGVDCGIVRLKLIKVGIPMRPRGGGNYKGCGKKRNYVLSRKVKMEGKKRSV